MLENAGVKPIKAYVKSSLLDFNRKLETLKQLAQIDRINAKEARKRRWQKKRFAAAQDYKDYTKKEIREIVTQWTRELKRFVV
jgi:hypothetical protein